MVQPHQKSLQPHLHSELRLLFAKHISGIGRMSGFDAKNEQLSEYNFKNDGIFMCYTYSVYLEYMKYNCYQVFYVESHIKSCNSQRFSFKTFSVFPLEFYILLA